MFDETAAGGEVPLTLYTDAFVIRGMIRTRQRRVTDILNMAEESFLVVSSATIDEYGSKGIASRSDYAQVNLSTVLFAVSDETIESRPDLTTPKVPEMAMITIPPFRITGRIHLLPQRELREALTELIGAFIPVTDAAYWSDTVGEARGDGPDPRVQPQPSPHPRAPHRGRSLAWPGPICSGRRVRDDRRHRTRR